MSMISYNASWAEVEALVKQATNALKQNDEKLFRVQANERSVTHRLGLYLEDLFPGWDVDCEYSRIGEDPSKYKKLLLPEDEGLTHFDMDGSRVYPDIVIHHRTLNTETHNLLVIEVKTAWSQVGEDQDIQKLLAFTGHYPVDQLVQYKFGLFLRFGDDGSVLDHRVFEKTASKTG
jgi:hypothetical protein